MQQLNFHTATDKIPPPPIFSSKIAVVNKLLGAYKIWHQYLIDFPRISRYTLGKKIDALFLETIELLFTAGHLEPGKKFPYLQKAASRFDLLRFFLSIAWEIKSLDTNRYAHLSRPLDEVGRMIGAWRKRVDKENSRH